MPLFRERQFLGKWVYFLLFLTSTLPIIFNQIWPAPDGIALPLLLIFGVLAIVMLVFGWMETEVYRDRLTVPFGLKLIRYSFPFTEIVKIEVRTYAPIGEFGGWGIRGFGDKRALNMRGNRGVELTIRKEGATRDATMMIGSQVAEQLEAALRDAMRS